MAEPAIDPVKNRRTMSGTLAVTPDEFLAHYGVPGMKWGRKKQRTQKEVAKRKNMQKASDNRRHLSDTELKARIERIQNEKKLKSLTDEELRPGQVIAKKLTSQAGQKVVGMILAGAMAYGVKSAMQQKFDVKEAAGYLIGNPNKKK